MSNQCFPFCSVTSRVVWSSISSALLFSCGFWFGQNWMFNRAQDASIKFGIEALTQETVKVTAYFTCIDSCALHHVLYNALQRVRKAFGGKPTP